MSSHVNWCAQALPTYLSSSEDEEGVLELDEETEAAACQLWDMTAEPEVAKHLMQLTVSFEYTLYRCYLSLEYGVANLLLLQLVS